MVLSSGCGKFIDPSREKNTNVQININGLFS